MKYLFSLSFLVSISISANAYECKSELFEKLKVIEKTSYRLPARDYSPLLQRYVDRYELLCPWQVEADLNGDGRKDWAGLVGERGRYQLVAFMSGRFRYKTVVVRHFDKFPDDFYLTSAPIRDAYLLLRRYESKKTLGQKKGSVLQVNWVNKESELISLYANKPETLLTYPNETSVESALDPDK